MPGQTCPEDSSHARVSSVKETFELGLSAVRQQFSHNLKVNSFSQSLSEEALALDIHNTQREGM